MQCTVPEEGRLSFKIIIKYKIPRIALALSVKAFSVSAPSVWNSLSYNYRSTELLGTFNRSLKTELVDIAYRKREHSAYSLCHYAPLIHSRHIALCKCVLIDSMID